MTTEKNSDIIRIVELVSEQKGLQPAVVLAAIEEALAAITAKRFPEEEVNIQLHLDPKTGATTTQLALEVVEADNDVESPNIQISLASAKETVKSSKVGDTFLQDIPSESFGRIDASQAKQMIVKIVRDAEREKKAQVFKKSFLYEIVPGEVKHSSRDQVIVELGDGIDGYLGRNDLIPKESIHARDRIKAYVYDINESGKGPLVKLSRSCPEILTHLFSIEVPEISEGVIEVKAVARDPGVRAKIAVKSNDTRIDPIGACVGMRGSRVQAVSSELNNERIDIVLWNDTPAHLVINALSPAEISAIDVNEQNLSMDIAVEEDQLSIAIGKNGQNIRLASILTGWKLNIMSVAEKQSQQEVTSKTAQDHLLETLGIDDDVANVLIAAGYLRAEQLAHAEISELMQIEEFDEETANEISNRAKAASLTLALSGETSETQPQKDLLSLDSVPHVLAMLLAEKGITTRDGLAELSVDELIEKVDTLSEEDAAKVIMEARAHWFDEEEGENT
jgi:transcription termination/antitermination protein NusA